MEVFLNPLTEDILVKGETPLFHQLPFHEINYKLPEYQFFFKEDEEVINSLFFHSEERYLVSTTRSSFGGFSFYAENQSDLLKEVKTFLPESKKLKIINAPLSYGFSEEGIITMATEIKKEINQSVVLKGWEETILSTNRRKVLRKSVNNNFVFNEVGAEWLGLVYNIIDSNRSRKGFPTTMTFAQLEKVIKAFPEYYRLFLVSDSAGKPLSSAVVLKINSKISYLFYLGAGPEELSGNTFLVVQLIKKLQKEGVELFDLGVSSVEGVVNNGLFRFKEGFGCTASDKLTLIY